jgi:hypothetical protein
VEGSDYGLIEVLSQYFPGETEENDGEISISITWKLGWDFKPEISEYDRGIRLTWLRISGQCHSPSLDHPGQICFLRKNLLCQHPFLTHNTRVLIRRHHLLPSYSESCRFTYYFIRDVDTLTRNGITRNKINSEINIPVKQEKMDRLRCLSSRTNFRK